MKLRTALLYLVARLEVSYALLTDNITNDAIPFDDSLPTWLIPTVRLGNLGDRVLAEIDQDGFIFAVDSRDEALFNTRSTMVPRRHHRINIVLTRGSVRLRKSAVQSESVNILTRVVECLRLGFYLEAAALLRLRGLPYVPAIRLIEAKKSLIEMDYVWGQKISPDTSWRHT